MAAVAQAEAFLGRVEGGLAQPEEFELDGQAVMKVAVSARGGVALRWVDGAGSASFHTPDVQTLVATTAAERERGVAGLCLGCGQTGAL